MSYKTTSKEVDWGADRGNEVLPPWKEATKKPPAIKSDFALLDVKGGRRALFKALGFTKRFEGAEPISVVITGRILGAWGHDDGTSQEFEIEVTGVHVT